MNKLLLATLLTSCFGSIALEAQVDRGKDPNAPCVVVGGAVHMPMRFELKERPVRIMDALAFAGGPTAYASGTVKLIRTEQSCYAEAWSHKVWPDRPLQVTELAFKDIARGDAKANLYLNPGDVVLVAESDPIYVSGSVASERSIYFFKEAPSVLNAIALAGGPLNSTSETEVIIFRAGDDKHYKEVLRTNLGELEKHPKQSPILRANDIIHVGPGNLLPPMSPLKFDAPPFDYRPSPSPNRARNGIITL